MKKRFYKLDKTSVIENIKPTLMVILGGMILGISYSKWMVPNNIINGGVTSLSMILSKVTGFDVDLYTTTLTLFFLFLSVVFLGKKNFILSIISSIAYTQSFSFFYRMDFSLQVNIVVDLILASVFIGIGYYLCLEAGASTVGVEVIALIIYKYDQSFELSKLIRFLNYIVLILGLMIYGGKAVIIGVIFSFTYSKFLGFLLNFNKGEMADEY